MAAFSDAEEAVQTCLDAGGPNLALLDGTRAPFGSPIITLAPPAHWCFALSGEEPVVGQGNETGPRFAIGNPIFLFWTLRA